ncbi:MAG: hypothetical protein ACEY3K_12270 [Wolbachia sp.]
MNEIDIIYTSPSYLNSEQESGDGYFKLTNCSFDERTGCHQVAGEILDTNHNTIGNATIYECPTYVHKDDHEFNIQIYREFSVKGDMEKISSLKKSGKVTFV